MFRLKIKEVAVARGVNKSQLSRRADLGMTTINELWDGTREDVKLSTLAAIARALGVEIEELYEELDGGIIPDSIEALAYVPAA